MLNFIMGYVAGERTAARAAGYARSAGTAAQASVAGDLYDIEERMERMLLVIEAMWSLMRENGLTDDDLAARIRELDESDGIADGKRTPQPVRCPACDSMVSPGRPACAFCGEPVAVSGPLDGI